MAAPSFQTGYSYEVTEAGIILPVQLQHSDISVRVEARLDTAAAFCLFDRLQGELLGLNVERGIRQKFRTINSSFVAFGHELTLRTFHLEWNSVVYFYENSFTHGNFLGRTGWLDRIRLGMVHYDQQIYLGSYDLTEF